MYIKQFHLALLGLLLPAAVIAASEPPAAKDPAQSIKMNQNSAPESGNNTNDKQVLPRGQLLYENHCGKCHESQVHIRENHKARSIADVQAWVAKWQTHEKLGWKADEINDVTRYLVERYYHFK